MTFHQPHCCNGPSTAKCTKFASFSRLSHSRKSKVNPWSETCVSRLKYRLPVDAQCDVIVGHRDVPSNRVGMGASSISSMVGGRSRRLAPGRVEPGSIPGPAKTAKQFELCPPERLCGTGPIRPRAGLSTMSAGSSAHYTTKSASECLPSSAVTDARVRITFRARR